MLQNIVMRQMPGQMQTPQGQPRMPNQQQFYHGQRPMRIPEVTEVTMGEREENVALVDSAVSTSSVASTNTDSETHRNVRNYWVIFSIFYSIKLSSTTSDKT